MVRTVASGLGFTEGPIWTIDERLIVTSITRGLLYEVALDGSGGIIHAETGGGPNGLAQDREGALWVAQNGGVIIESKSARPASQGLQRVLDGVVEDVIVADFDAPNDCVFGADGRLWFTDPRAPGGEEHPGRVWVFDQHSGECRLMAEGIPFPNGLAFTPDGEHLFVADSERCIVVRFRVESDRLSGGEEFAALAGTAPDGIAVDARGWLYVAATTADAIMVFDQLGALREVIELGGPSMATNVCFGGPDLGTLYVTAAKGGRVLAVEGDFVGAAPTRWV